MCKITARIDLRCRPQNGLHTANAGWTVLTKTLFIRIPMYCNHYKKLFYTILLKPLQLKNT